MSEKDKVTKKQEEELKKEEPKGEEQLTSAEERIKEEEQVRARVSEFVPLVKSDTQFDFKTLKYANLYLSVYKRKSWILSLVVAIAALGMAIYSAIASQWVFFVIFLLFVAVIVYQALTVEKKIDQELVKYFKNREVGGQEVALNKELILVENKNSTIPFVYEWSDIKSVDEITEYVYLFLGAQAPIIIDKNRLVVGDLKALQEIVKEKFPEKGYKVIEKEIAKRKIEFEHEVVEEDDKIEIVKLSAEEEAKVKAEQDKKAAEKIEEEKGKKE
ncbi:MAG TPA: hypothetical protein GXZ51_03605 [Acholeplasma sp.]|nr:hypothetical protein [Acholeplasma sp.]